MILTVTLNAAIDKTLTVPNFQVGRRHRSVSQQSMAGGKGINVARALKRLGRPVIATGLAGGATGTRIVEELTAESILNDFVRIQEESRTNISVLDPTTGQQTEINERGPRVSEVEIATFKDKLLYLARGAAIVVFAGSLPRGVDPGFYADLVQELKGMGLTTIVDADGEPLRLAVKAGPDLVSPNVVEAEELVGHEFGDEGEQLAGVGEIVELGAKEAVITRSDGCVAQLLLDGKPVRFRARIAEREPVAPVGSGDAFLAGYVAARYEGESPDQCLRLAVASGADSLARMGAGVVELKGVERLVSEVEVERIEVSPSGTSAGDGGTMRKWR
jgi:1-phosphofructokinase family hexose kinase